MYFHFDMVLFRWSVYIKYKKQKGPRQLSCMFWKPNVSIVCQLFWSNTERGWKSVSYLFRSKCLLRYTWGKSQQELSPFNLSFNIYRKKCMASLSSTVFIFLLTVMKLRSLIKCHIQAASVFFSFLFVYSSWSFYKTAIHIGIFSFTRPACVLECELLVWMSHVI